MSEVIEKPTKDDLLVYVRTIADLLELKDWRFDIKDEPCNPQAWFSVNGKPNQKHADLYCAWDWTTLTAEKLRHSIIHEMMHVHWMPAWDYVTARLSELETDAWKYMAEYSIDGTARAIAEHYPLPHFKCADES